jgi:DNA invertase Pin-like site-specific DNA recombinase
MRIYGYLRASTKEQDAKRAKYALSKFTEEIGQPISAWFIENESGATLKRPELFRLLDVCQPNDILLVEQVDRISRLNGKDWESLKAIILQKGIRIVALDLPTSHQFMKTESDEFTMRMFSAINEMMLEMLAAIARKDYEDRRRRQAEGVQRAKKEGKYKGRPEDKNLQNTISALLKSGHSYRQINKITGASNATISKVKRN